MESIFDRRLLRASAAGVARNFARKCVDIRRWLWQRIEYLVDVTSSARAISAAGSTTHFSRRGMSVHGFLIIRFSPTAAPSVGSRAKLRATGATRNEYATGECAGALAAMFASKTNYYRSAK